jgi:F0F1-type ATP synthase gamma subunit
MPGIPGYNGSIRGNKELTPKGTRQMTNTQKTVTEQKLEKIQSALANLEKLQAALLEVQADLMNDYLSDNAQ